jgi:hypothetical protein
VRLWFSLFQAVDTSGRCFQAARISDEQTEGLGDDVAEASTSLKRLLSADAQIHDPRLLCQIVHHEAA